VGRYLKCQQIICERTNQILSASSRKEESIMPQIINTNIASMTAQRNLNNSQSANETAMTRLSSGLRINSAKDDAAGLAISTRFDSQIKGLNVAVRNAGDGVSLVQTAEGALGSMTDNLQRVRELAVQSSNSTNSDEDRVALQAEVEQLMSEVGRTAEETTFNGRALLDGSFEGTFQIGADAGQTVDVNISELTLDKLGASSQAGVSATSTNVGIDNGDLSINGTTIAASVAADDSSSTAMKEASSISKAAAINKSSDETGVVAFVNENVVEGSTMTGTTATAVGPVNVELNGVSIDIIGTDNSTDVERTATRNSVISAINAKAEQTGVVASNGGDEQGVILTAEDGRNIQLTATAAGGNDLTVYGLRDDDTAGLGTISTTAATEAGVADTSVGAFTGGLTLVSDGATKEIDIEGGNATGTGDIKNSGLTEGTFSSEVAYVTSEQVSVGNTALAANTAAALDAALQSGDITINGTAIRASSGLDDTASFTNASTSNGAASGIAIAAAINDSTDNTGVTATVNETTVVGSASAAATASAGTAGNTVALELNGVSITLAETGAAGSLAQNRTAAAEAINAVSGQTGVMAEDNGETLTLTAADGRNITLDADEAGGGGDLNNFGLEATASGTTTEATTHYSTVTLSSASEITIASGNNGRGELDNTGFTEGSYGGGEDGQFLKDVDISTFEGAQSALTAIDNALGEISSQRADLGAVQNRFESTMDNLAITTENLSAANSRIKDADFAKETAEMSRTQVLQQAGISILAQANQKGQSVLSLLG
jgi:flagellin